MNIIIGLLMFWICYRHVRVAVNPNEADRAYVRWNAVALAMLTGFIGLVFLGLIGPGPA